MNKNIQKKLKKCEFLGVKLTQEEKVRFLLQSAFKVNRNNVKMLKGVWGPKIHCQNIVDGRYFQKNSNFWIFVVKNSLSNFVAKYILNPVFNNHLWLKFLT